MEKELNITEASALSQSHVAEVVLEHLNTTDKCILNKTFTYQTKSNEISKI